MHQFSIFFWRVKFLQYYPKFFYSFNIAHPLTFLNVCYGNQKHGCSSHVNPLLSNRLIVYALICNELQYSFIQAFKFLNWKLPNKSLTNTPLCHFCQYHFLAPIPHRIGLRACEHLSSALLITWSLSFWTLWGQGPIHHAMSGQWLLGVLPPY